MIIDASVVLSAFFPDEAGQAAAHALIRAFVREELELLAPTLLPYEVTNAVLQAIRRDRIALETGREILSAFEALGIPVGDVTWQRALELAHIHDRSGYDAAYLALAEETGSEYVTGDRRLHNAVKDRLPWVRWLGDLA